MLALVLFDLFSLKVAHLPVSSLQLRDESSVSFLTQYSLKDLDTNDILKYR
jgi:hypothetical protein